MSARNKNRTVDNVLQKNFNIPIQPTDLSMFDDAFSSMKERFQAEMRRVDEEMTRFSTNLMYLYGQPVPGVTSDDSSPESTNWDTITNSPLVTGEGESKTLKLQFDVSAFKPNEISVKILDNVLLVSARHEEKTTNHAVYREYHREFVLPRGIDAEAVVSSLSRDGVLMIQTPMPQFASSQNAQLVNPQIMSRRSTA